MNRSLQVLVLLGLVLGLVYGNGRQGGVQDYNFQPENDQTDKLALDAALGHIQKSNEALIYKGVQSCRAQVVAGRKYYLILNFLNSEEKLEQYEFVIYVRPWEEFVEVQVVKKLEEDPSVSTDLSKNVELKQLIQRFLSGQIRSRVNFDLTDFELTDMRVLEHRIVSGDIYKLVVQFTSGENVKEYLVEVWSRPWLSPSLELVSVKDHQKESLPRTLRAQDVSGGFIETHWDNQGETEQKILLEITNYLKSLINSDQVEIFDIYDVGTKPLAVIHYRLTISYSFNGKARKQASVELTFNPRSGTVKVTSFMYAQPKNVGKDGGYQDYKWDSEADIEKQVLKFLTDYGTKSIAEDFAVLKILKAESKIVNGVIFRLHLNYQAQNTSLNATTEVYAQVWTNTFEVLSFVKERKLEL